MTTRKRRQFTAEFKARVAIEAIKGQKTIQEIAAHYEVHPNMVTTWKRQALAELPQVFSDQRSRAAESDEALKDALYQQIGKLQVQLDWLKKKSGISG
jgi:transposase-like protein